MQIIIIVRFIFIYLFIFYQIYRNKNMLTKRKLKSAHQKERYSQPDEFIITPQYDLRKMISGKIQNTATQKIFSDSQELGFLSQKVFDEKQKLYKRVLRLKQQVEKVKDENIKLKAKLITTEKQNEKLNNILICQFHDKHGSIIPNPQKILSDNQYIFSLKRKNRDQKEEIQYLKLQVIDLKKKKISKIQEILEEEQNFEQQNVRFSKILQQIREHMKQQEQRYKNQIIDLKSQINKQKLQSIQINQQKNTLEEAIQTYSKNEIKNQQNLILLQEKLQSSRIQILNLQKQLQSKQMNAQTKTINQENHPEKNQITNYHRYKFKKSQDQPKTFVVCKLSHEQQIKYFKEQFQYKIKTLQNKIQQSDHHIEQLKIKLSQEKTETLKTIKKSISIKNQYNIMILQHKQYLEMQETKQTRQSDIQKGTIQKQIIKKIYQFKLNNFKNYVTEFLLLKELLAFRCRARRFTIDYLTKWLQKLNKQAFLISELENIFINEPFLLKRRQLDTLMIYLFDISKIKNTNQYNYMKISCDIVRDKLVSIIGNFVINQVQEEIAYVQIAEMISEHRDQLRLILDNNRNYKEQQEEISTIDASVLIKLLKGMEMEDYYIEVIVSELCLVSQNMRNMNYMCLFQLFKINRVKNNQIDITIQNEQLQN